MIRTLAFIGGGSTGHAAAAFFSLRGFEVRLCDDERYRERFAAIDRRGGILLRGVARGLGKVHTVTTNPAQAVPGAEAIFINVVAARHEEVARTIAPHLQNGQHIIICPGNLGSFVFRRVFRQLGMDKDVTVSELEGNLFPCRLTGEAEAIIGLPFGPKSIAALPAADTSRVVAALEGVMELQANETVFVCVLNSTNFVMHLGATLLSATRIHRRGAKFNMFKEGLTPQSVACSRKIEEERRAVMVAMGLEPHADPIEFMESLTNEQPDPLLMDFLSLGGPDSTTHRYVSEDALCNAAFCVSAGRRLGVPCPVLEAFITIAGTINGTDYLACGRTLENLGFAPNLSYKDIEKSL